MRNLSSCTRKNVCYMGLHSDLANRWSFPHAQGNKNAGYITNNNSLTSGDFVFPVEVWLCAQTESDISDDQLFKIRFRT